MSEDKEEAQEKPAEGDSDKGVQPETDSPVDRASKILEGIKAENERYERNIKQMQELQANQMISGRAQAGQKPKTQEDEVDEIVDESLKDMGY